MAADAPEAALNRATGILVMVLRFLARRWLLWANAIVAVYLGIAVLAPVLMATGHQLAAELIHWAYGYMCHQWPDRSYFLFAQEAVYSLEFLDTWFGQPVTSTFRGSPELGYKVALCQRDVAQFGSILLGGVTYAVLRSRVRPLRWWGLLAMALPMAIDGGVQLFGLWESNWWRRTVTGGLFGLACVWWAYPRLDSAMAQISEYLARPVSRRSGESRRG